MGVNRLKDIFLLDMDDTLLDFQRAEKVNLAKSLKEVGVDMTEEIFKRFHLINDGLWKALERGEIEREALKVKRFERLFEEFRLDGDARDAARRYFENFPAISFPFAGAKEFLQTLAEKGRVYIVTNGGAAIQRRHIADSGFSPFLSGVFISEETGYNKPSKQFAEYAEAHIPQYERARAVWVGDSLTSDARCAESLGIDFILFCPSGAPNGYSGRFAKDYGQVLKLLFGETSGN